MSERRKRRRAMPVEVRDEIRRACYLLMEDDGFHEAMEILCPLAGLEFPAATVEPEPVEIMDIEGSRR